MRLNPDNQKVAITYENSRHNVNTIVVEAPSTRRGSENHGIAFRDPKGNRLLTTKGADFRLWSTSMSDGKRRCIGLVHKIEEV